MAKSLQTRTTPSHVPELAYPKMRIFKPHTYNPSSQLFAPLRHPSRLNIPTMIRRAREDTFLRKGFLAPLPSCTTLVQLAVILTPYIITSEYTTIYMRGVSRSYNTRRAYGQVRLGKTHDHFPLVGGYNNFSQLCPSSAAP